MGEWATLWALGPGYPCPPPRWLAVTLIRGYWRRQVRPKPCGERSVRCFSSDHLHSLCELLPDVASLTPLRWPLPRPPLHACHRAPTPS